jgi:uncharacterized damage-inducible protein DinB
MNAPLASVFRYNKWANSVLLEACRALPDDVLDAHVAGVPSSVRETLVHLVGAQQTLVLRTKGRQHEGELNRRSAWPGFDQLIRIAENTSDDLIAIAESMDGESTADLTYMGKVSRWPHSFFLTHALEHGMEHRTEVKVALAALGIVTPDLDGWAYAAANGIGEEL